MRDNHQTLSLNILIIINRMSLSGISSPLHPSLSVPVSPPPYATVLLADTCIHHPAVKQPRGEVLKSDKTDGNCQQRCRYFGKYNPGGTAKEQTFGLFSKNQFAPSPEVTCNPEAIHYVYFFYSAFFKARCRWITIRGEEAHVSVRLSQKTSKKTEVVFCCLLKMCISASSVHHHKLHTFPVYTQQSRCFFLCLDQRASDWSLWDVYIISVISLWDTAVCVVWIHYMGVCMPLHKTEHLIFDLLFSRGSPPLLCICASSQLCEFAKVADSGQS